MDRCHEFELLASITVYQEADVGSFNQGENEEGSRLFNLP
jgi:hypothetical protein